MHLIDQYRFALPCTWNPADKASNLTLSGGNLTVALTSSGGAFAGVRGTRSRDAAGTGYFELSVGATSSPSDIVTGLALAAAPLTYPGDSGSQGVGYYHRNGQILFNAGATSYGTSVVAGNVVRIAFKNGSMWVGKGSVWQGSGDPVAGTNPAITGLTGPLFPMVGLFSLSDSVTGKFKTADFSFSPPTGFDPWDAP